MRYGNGEGTKKSKRNNKAARRMTVVVSCVCAIILLAILFVFFFADMMLAHIRLNAAVAAVGEARSIVVSDPLYDGGLLPTAAEIVLNGESAEELALSLESAADELSFRSVVKSGGGFWSMRAVFEADGRSYCLYFKEDEVYLLRSSKGAYDTAYAFDAKEDGEYGELYRDLRDRLDASAGQ